MAGLEQYTNTRLGITINSWWLNSASDTVSPKEVSSWLDEIDAAYPNHWEIFDAVTTINLWHPDRPDCPEIKRYAGLTYWDGHIDINKPYVNRGTISHEFGHWVALYHKIDPNTTDPVGKAMWKIYERMRGMDFTAATPGAERWAEDFKNLYGAKGVQGQVDPNDDSTKPGSSVRKAWDVPGLAVFLNQFPTLMKRWFATGGIGNAYFNTTNNIWSWTSPGFLWIPTYEYSDNGAFYVWSWSRWVKTA